MAGGLHFEDRFEALTEARKKLGLSLRDIQVKTQIPQRHLEALEAGALDEIPDGPYLEGYYKAYCRAVGMRPASTGNTLTAKAPQMHPKRRLPFWVVRLVAFASMALLMFWAGGQLVQSRTRSTLPNERATAATEALVAETQTLKLSVRKTGHFEINIDGERVHEGILEEGEERIIRSSAEIELLVPGAGSVRIEYNGRQIVPQGLQDKPRRLTFIDDNAGSAQ